jgi:hypothetical protein
LDSNLVDVNSVVGDLNSVGTDAFVNAIGSSNVKQKLFELLLSYADLFYRMFATGGVSGVASFSLVVIVVTFVLMQIVPVKMPKFVALALATLFAVLTAPFIIVPIYLFFRGIIGV